MSQNKMPKSPNIPKNVCLLLLFHSSDKTDLPKHILQHKHIITQNDTINPQKSPYFMQNIK